LSIPQLIRQDEIVIEDEAVGIVAPVYAVEMPMMVKAFLEKAKIKTDYYLEALACSGNKMTALDISHNLKLKELCCDDKAKVTYANEAQEDIRR